MIVLGLTGSIGMGKSTTAAMFRDAGVPVYDSDAMVHELYSGELAGQIEAAFPGTTVNGKVDRARLSQKVLGNSEALQRLEVIVHPAVRAKEAQFRTRASAAGAPLVVLDIPLLFEAGRSADVDRIAVVSCPMDLQRQRVLARPGMTTEKFESILARQMPDAEKRARADFIIETGEGLEIARRAVDQIISELTGGK